MSDKPKFPRADALAVARELCAALKPVTEKLIVAGSLRRGRLEVGDVEICYIARIEPRADPLDLLQNPVRTNLVDELLGEWLRAGRLQLRLKENGQNIGWGAENKYAIHTASGIPVDFFAGNSENWWTLLVCRTGSAENNTRICNAAIERGLKWNPYRGFEDRASGKIIFTPRSEQAVFQRVGLPWLEPAQR